MASKYNDDYDALPGSTPPERPSLRSDSQQNDPQPSSFSGPSAPAPNPSGGVNRAYRFTGGRSKPSIRRGPGKEAELPGLPPKGSPKANRASQSSMMGPNQTGQNQTGQNQNGLNASDFQGLGMGSIKSSVGKSSGRNPSNSSWRVSKGVGPSKSSVSNPNPGSPTAPGGSQVPVGAQPKKWFGTLPVSLLGLRWLRSWPVVVLIIFGILGTAGTTAVLSLFRIPNLPNCRAIFWPTASASLRLQCAESYAAQGDVENLLAAIALVDKLPEDHPLRSDIINDRIENWANQVLDLAETSFEEGELDVAIAYAKKIPQRTAAAKVVEARIARWQKIWKDGEDGFNVAVENLKQKDFQKAFSLSVALLDVDNKFWSTVKYNELTKLISLAREDSRKMSDALGLAKEGTVKGYVAALKKLKEINQESVFYSEAQGERKAIAKKMLEQGEENLANQQLSAAQALLNAIPRDTGLDREIADFQVFVTAYQQAWTGSAGGLENAINRMATLGKDRPRYAQGQRLIAQWQGELQNISLLNQAKERAGRGSTADLTAAISIARQVGRNSPQEDEAAEQINQWQSRVESVQDRPILERADRLAAQGTPDNLRAAIQEARKVSSGRTLGPEADERIYNWTERIQRIEDQPVLDQARARARAGDVSGAIAIANRIGEGRSLYEQAQGDVAEWQATITGRSRLAEAVTAASSGGSDALVNAIKLAQQVPERSDSRARADEQVTQWSWSLLRQAEAASRRNLATAISLASSIPSGTEAYSPAQVRIQNWQATLNQIEESRQPAPAPVDRTDGRQEGAPLVPPAVDENGVPGELELVPPRDR
ncbi:MAG: chromosome segregation ATPase [Cyanobacteria bacterium J06598_3]